MASITFSAVFGGRFKDERRRQARDNFLTLHFPGRFDRLWIR
jgi:hypothetical protein